MQAQSPQASSDRSVTKIAPAKVNLFLHITGRRQNGFHELESLFAFTQKGDEIKVSDSESLELIINGPFADELIRAGGEQENNLVFKAAKLLAAHCDREALVTIELTKNLPVAAGVGGGSADAAATLLALRELWQLDIGPEVMADIALQLGADVPACLHQSPLYVRGIGEAIEQRSLPKSYGILLVNPRRSVSTPVVFQAFKEDEDNKFDLVLGADYHWPDTDSEFLQFLQNDTRNALQKSAVAVCEAISEVLDALSELPNIRYSAMSGSGATCFALFDGPEGAEEAQQCLYQQNSSWWSMADALVAC